jgi:WD40 repeat protein/nitrate/nitrite transporter NarK
MHPASARRYHWVILALVLLAQFLPPLVLFSIGALAPLLRDALALSHGQIGFLAALFSMSAALCAIPSGWGADKLGIRGLLCAVQAVGGLALVATAWLRTYAELCLVLFLAGMTFTTVLVLTSKAIAEWFPRGRRSTAMGAKSAAVAGAGIVAGAVMLPLALRVGWRQAFACVGGLMLASACCDLLLYRERSQDTSPAAPLPMAAPQRALWRNRHIWALALAGFCFGGVQYAFTTYLVLFLDERWGVSAILAASLLAQAHVGAAVSRVPYGWLSDRWLEGDCKAMLQWISAVALGIMLLLLLLPPSLPLLLLSIIILLYGLSGLAWGGLYQTLSVELSGQERAGVSSGITTTLLHLGNFALVPAFGYMVDVTGSYTRSWGLLMLAQLCGIVLLGWVRIAPETPQGMAAHDAPSSHPRWWWGVTATASLLAVAGLVGLLPFTHPMVSERDLRGLVQRTRSLLAGAGVETLQQSAEMVPSPSAPALSAPPTPTAADSPTTAPTAMSTTSGQVAVLPETPPADPPPLPSAAIARVPPTVVQDLVLPLEIAMSEPPPVILKQPEATQIPLAPSPPVVQAPSLSAPRLAEHLDGQTGSLAGPERLPHAPAPGAQREDNTPDPQRSTAVRTPSMAAGSETPGPAEASVPAARASTLSKRERLPPSTANAEGRARPRKREQPAVLPESPTPAAPAKTASVSAPIPTGQDQAGIRGTKPADALGRLPAPGRGTTQDRAPRGGAAVPTPSPGVRLPEGPPQLVVEAGGHTAMIRKLLFTADGHELVSVSDDKTIRVWAVSPDGRQARLARTIRGSIGEGREGTLAAATLSPPEADGRQRWLAVGGLFAGTAEERYAIRLHDYGTGEIKGLLYGHHDMILALAFSPTGRWLASAGKDGTIRLWDLAALQGRTLPPAPLVLTAHTDHIYELAWSVTGERLASASYDRTVGLWNTTQLAQQHVTLVERIRGHEDQVQTVAFHPSGTVLASGGKDQTVRLWQAWDGAALGVWARLPHKVAALAFAPDGSRVLAGNFAPPLPDRLTLLAYPSGKTERVFTGHQNVVLATAFHPSGQWVATGGGEHKEILLWQVPSGEVVARLEGRGRTIYAVGFSPDGRYLSWGQTAAYTAANRQGPLEHWFDLTQLTHLPGGLAEVSPVQARERLGPLALALEPGGPYKHNARLHVHDGARRLSTIERGQTDGYRHSAYTLTPDGQGVLSGGANGVLRLYGLDGTLRANLVGHTGEIKAVAVAADGRWALSGANDQTLCLWALPPVLPASPSVLKPTLTLFPAQDGEWVAWTPEGYLVASAQGLRLIGASINEGVNTISTYVAGEQLRERFYRPALIQAKLHEEPRLSPQSTVRLHTDP